MSNSLLKEALRFGGVGSVGFVVDGGLLWVLLLAGIDPYLARLISFPIAVLVTWLLNRTWTFENADQSKPAAQFGRYLSVQLVGAISNYLIYALVVTSFPGNIAYALVGFALGSFVGMFINFFGSRYYAFKP